MNLFLKQYKKKYVIKDWGPFVPEKVKKIFKKLFMTI